MGLRTLAVLSKNYMVLEQLHIYKVDTPKVATYPNWTPIFEWRMVWCGSKNEYQEEMF